MKTRIWLLAGLILLCIQMMACGDANVGLQVETENGTVEGLQDCGLSVTLSPYLIYRY